MATQQGGLELLNDPVARQLLESPLPAHLAYTWTDGTPRVVPIGFHWNGTELVMCGAPDAPKMKALKDGDHVAISIDSTTMPFKVLLIRGTVRMDEYDGMAPEYAALIERMMGAEGGRQWLGMAGAMWPRMERLFVTPTWVGVIDFETRFPSPVEHGMARLQAVA
ncbi:MAG: hypothetical protein RLZZ387_4861 [Chloroflexota bacterium]|jgi:hypothetical protein